jgi:hypothetical protein
MTRLPVLTAFVALLTCCGKAPAPADVRRAVSLKYDAKQGGDPFTLGNACYQQLGDCRENDGRWTYSLDGVAVKDIGERHSARRSIRAGGGDLWHTQKWWPTKTELSVTCRCGGRSASIRVPESSDVTDYGSSGGWRTTNAL